MVESVNLSLVAGLAVDYVVHLSESYYQAPHDNRQRRVRDMLEHMGISVLSGAITTAGASAFLLFSQLFFFFQFGLFVLVTIFLSVFYCLFWFTPMLAVVGPEAGLGSLQPVFRWTARMLQSVLQATTSDAEHNKISYSRSSSYNVVARAKSLSSGILRRGVSEAALGRGVSGGALGRGVSGGGLGRGVSVGALSVGV